jgi:2-polyprenyl-3-methyl-5-hydroxy-6-metoxy-1,4-benzoquinol methylase
MDQVASTQAVPCPLCGGRDFKPVKRFDDGIVVGRCAACGFLHTPLRHPTPDAVLAPGDLDVLRERYRAVLDGTSHHYRRSHYREYLALVGRHAPVGRLLDVGCAHGFLGREARALGYRVTGVEPHRGMAAFARAENGLEVMEGTLADVDLGDRVFEAVTFTDSFEYVPRPVEGLTKVARHLAPGGAVFIKVPNALNSLLRMRLEAWGLGGGAGAFSPSMRVAHYTPATLARTLESAGLQVLEVGHPAPIHSPTRQAEREGRAELPPRPGEALGARVVRTAMEWGGRVERVVTGRNHLAQSLYAVARSAR